MGEKILILEGRILRLGGGKGLGTGKKDLNVMRKDFKVGGRGLDTGRKDLNVGRKDFKVGGGKGLDTGRKD